MERQLQRQHVMESDECPVSKAFRRHVLTTSGNISTSMPRRKHATHQQMMQMRKIFTKEGAGACLTFPHEVHGPGQRA